MTKVNTALSIGELKLANPVMVASGTFGFGEEYADLMDVNALGAVVTKGVSLEARRGNPPPRTIETPAGMLNSVGLENPGVEVFLRDKLPWLRKIKPAVIVNIFGSTIEEYGRLAQRLDGQEGIDALEVNISCPNVKQGGIAFGSDADLAYQVSAHVAKSCHLPVLVKCSPNVTDLVAIAKRVADAGVAGLTLINTLRGMAIDYRTGRPMLGNGIGGLSGPAIRPVAIRAVFEVCAAVDLPVVGCGGIVQWQDAVEFMRAGACAVQVGSATFRNPKTANGVLAGMTAFAAEQGLHSTQSLMVTAHAKSVPTGDRKEPGA